MHGTECCCRFPVVIWAKREECGMRGNLLVGLKLDIGFSSVGTGQREQYRSCELDNFQSQVGLHSTILSQTKQNEN